jgi:REP element-mobilizing transposase RayT
LSQRQYAESVIPLICQTGVWFYHIAAAGEDHVHVLLTADADGAAVRKWFKRWLGEKLSKKWPFSTGQSYWSEGGSVKWVWKEDYFHNIFNYISHQRATP